MSNITKVNLNDSLYNIKDSEARSRITLLNELIDRLNAVDVDLYSYGIEWDSTVSSPVVTRIGNPLLHKSLPIQSAYRGCVANGSLVVYYLDPNDWNFKADGTPSVLDGTDGTVRVHIPKFYGKSGKEGTKRWVRISTIKIDDSWMEIPEMLVDAYRCTLDTTGVTKTASVVNTTEAFRGGGNRASYDQYLTTEIGTKDIFRSDLCKPRTTISRATMRTYAANANSELLCYEYYKWIFCWNYIIEYANFNAQAAYNEELTPEGYHQGGLGAGISTMSNWSSYNGYYPITPCGYGNEIGNFTGIKLVSIPAFNYTNKEGVEATQAALTMNMPRWRGFDNPFGDIWTNLDGIILERTAASQPSNVYTTTNVSLFGDTQEAKSKMTIAGIETVSEGWITDLTLEDNGNIIPSKCGGSPTTYMCDYHYCNLSITSLRTLLVGGYAADGGRCGPLCFCSAYGVGNARAIVGFYTLSRVN